MARPPKVTDEEILAVACRCFLEGGPSVPTTAIADELGVSQAALFKRFGTKHELLVQAVAPPDRPDFLDFIEAGPVAERPVRQQVTEMAFRVLGFFRMMMPRVALLKAAGISPLEMFDRFEVPPPVLGHRAISGWFQRAEDLGLVAPHDSDSVAFLFMGMLHGRSVLQTMAGQFLPEFDVDAYVAETVRVLFEGLDVVEAP